MYKEDLALNNTQWLICHKTLTKPNQSGKKIPTVSNKYRLVINLICTELFFKKT